MKSTSPLAVPDLPELPLITPLEAARRLRLDQVTKHPRRVVLAMIRRGELRGVPVSRFMMVDPASVERIIQGRG